MIDLARGDKTDVGICFLGGWPHAFCFYPQYDQQALTVADLSEAMRYKLLNVVVFDYSRYNLQQIEIMQRLVVDHNWSKF